MDEATSELLAEANEIVREQLTLAWGEHVQRIRETLEAQWPERMERVLEETVAGLAARVEEQHREALEGRLQQANRSAESARRELIQKLNQVARRFRGIESERQWANTLVDSTRGFCGRAALFLVRDGELHLETTRNFDDADLADAVPLGQAPAFATAVETRDTLVAMRTAGELSPAIDRYLGEADDPDNPKCYLFPVIVLKEVPAVLYADSGAVDVDAIELLVAMASAARNAQPVAATQPGSPLVTIAAAPAQKPEILSWFTLSPEDRELHLRAQRFARVQVAQMRLFRSSTVTNGRTAHDLYTSLKKEIDSARETFGNEFCNRSDSMVDYLHLELVRTLANDDAEVLGQNYPGPMV